MERAGQRAGIKLGVIGAGGRMGRAIIEAVRAAPGARLGGAVEHADHPCVGQMLDEGLTIGANVRALAHACDVLLDFTQPQALGESLEAAQSARCALLVGTTGLTVADHGAIDAAARSIAVLQAANTSLGVAVLVAAVAAAARQLADWDAEVLDLHHRDKLDAPSGTALLLGEAIARARGTPASPPADRFAPRAPRPPGHIGYAALRGGSAAGEHQVLLLGPGERLELAHRAEDRAIFARGAVRAACWLAGRPAGRYAMADMLGLA